jgi:hypothetical protein
MAEITRARCTVFREFKKKAGTCTIIWKLEMNFEDIVDGDKKVLELT